MSPDCHSAHLLAAPGSPQAARNLPFQGPLLRAIETGASDPEVARAASPAHLPRAPPRAGKDQRKGFTETDYARLLDAAHQQLAGPLVVVWDNLNSHLSAPVTEVIAARDWLTVYRLPPHAHKLNPVELVWPHLKRSLTNLAKHNLAQLTALVKTRLKGGSTGPASSTASSPTPAWILLPSVTSTIRDL